MFDAIVSNCGITSKQGPVVAVFSRIPSTKPRQISENVDAPKLLVSAPLRFTQINIRIANDFILNFEKARGPVTISGKCQLLT